MSCDIAEARNKKRDLETAIRDKISEFEEDTGLQVTDIWTQSSQNPNPGSYPRTRTWGVSVNIQLESLA